MGLPAGEIIYKAFVPTLKMAVCILAGFIMSKMDLLPRASIKGLSLITMNLSLPCLIFASMVSAFTPDNVKAFGPLVLCAIMYQALGGILAWVVQEVFYVPQDFRWGILVMGIISNWGNLPTAVVQTMAKEAPFNPETDVDLGVAYIAIFIFVMNTVFFALGVHKICGWDFIPDHMLAAQLPFRERWEARWSALKRCDAPKRLAEVCNRVLGRQKQAHVEQAQEVMPDSVPISSEKAVLPRKTRQPSFTAMIGPHRRIPPTAPLEAPEPEPIQPSVSRISRATNKAPPVREDVEDDLPTGAYPPYTLPHASTPHRPTSPSSSTSSTSPPSLPHSPTPTPTPTPLRSHFHPRRVFSRLLLLAAHTPPATYGIILGLIFSLVQPLKALLTPTDGWSGTRMPPAPDGNPPLSWILESATFIGAMTVPMALILLGCSFANLRVGNWREMPLGAIVAMTAVKMIIIPVFAIFVVQALRDNTGMFPPSQKIRTFVAILLSGTPAAANQLVITQLYNPQGTAHTLASFLLLQYILMFVLSTGLAAIALYIVE